MEAQNQEWGPGGGTYVGARQIRITGYNQRMAKRVARRARLDEQAVAVAFTYNNLLTMLVFGVVEEVCQFIPVIGGLVDIAVSLMSFYFHRILIVTRDNVYTDRDLPFHIPGQRLSAYRRGPRPCASREPNPAVGISRFIRRGQLTFHDGTVAFHQFLWIRRVQYIEQEANIPPA